MQYLLSGKEGKQYIDINSLKENIVYSVGVGLKDMVISWFWHIVESADAEFHVKLLSFVTGMSQMPLLGFENLNPKFGIHLDPNLSNSSLPISHTCFNSLILPIYKTYDDLKQKLTMSINSKAGFEL